MQELRHYRRASSCLRFAFLHRLTRLPFYGACPGT